MAPEGVRTYGRELIAASIDRQIDAGGEITIALGSARIDVGASPRHDSRPDIDCLVGGESSDAEWFLTSAGVRPVLSGKPASLRSPLIAPAS